MTIPLDRLYNHIDRISQDLCGDCLIIYRFFPHGSKNLENLRALKFNRDSKSWSEFMMSPSLICHDQEPLYYNLYSNDKIKEFIIERKGTPHYVIDQVSQMHLRSVTYWPFHCYDLVMLTHSEKNSTELLQYEANGFVGVYWWSHAVIARDWFRYAEHIQQHKQVNKTFLIYNRAWAGTREYRLKFSELLITHNLKNACLTNTNAIDPELGIHYSQHNFKNIIWKPNCVLENYYEPNLSDSHASADFDLADYENTNIEVVLETLFEDTRIHLTEKILRPIALGQPFILASTPGSLKYLHSYGFKTFDTVWSEHYDQITNARDRLEAITILMKSIADWSAETKQQKMAQAQKIADHNKKLFFSQSWHDQILDEYQQNFKSAWHVMKTHRTGKHFLQLRERAKTSPSLLKIINSDLPWRTRNDVQKVLDWIKHPT